MPRSKEKQKCYPCQVHCPMQKGRLWAGKWALALSIMTLDMCATQKVREWWSVVF